MPALPKTETNQLICIANQLTGFYMRVTLAFNELRLLLFLLNFRKQTRKNTD